MIFAGGEFTDMLFQMKLEDDPKTEEPNHNARPNLPATLRKMRRRKTRPRGEGDKRKSLDPRRAMKRMKKTTAV